jgi:energy-coupling factor transport system ATP-binding protein
VEDEVAFGLENLCVPAEEMDGRVGEALSEVGMAWARRRQVDTLSGGQKQRVALASVLAMRPNILVFDEPTANLDPAGTRGFFRTVEKLKRTGRHTMVIVEHEVDAFVHLVDRVAVLSAGGRVVADGSPGRSSANGRTTSPGMASGCRGSRSSPTACANAVPGSDRSP